MSDDTTTRLEAEQVDESKLKAHGHKPAWVGGKLTAECRAKLRAADLHFHDLRHEAGSRLLEAGWPLHHVQQMLGHANVKQTSTDLNATFEGVQASMRRFDEARGKPAANEAPTEHPLPRNDEQRGTENALVN